MIYDQLSVLSNYKALQKHLGNHGSVYAVP